VAVYFGPIPSHDNASLDTSDWPPRGTQDRWPHDQSNLVDGWKFPDPRDMAAYISRLVKSPKEWERHFEWRVLASPDALVPLSHGFLRMHLNDFTDRSSSNWLCRVTLC
jgi:hypothetical protein